jgi:L-amino acid N-acyltransferase YncA/AcrR family transcriptional regulator
MGADGDSPAVVLQATAQLIRCEGVAAATYERIAQESGLRERAVRKLFPDLEALRAQVLAVPDFSDVAHLIAEAAASQAPVQPLALFVEAGHRLYASASSNWSPSDLEALVRAAANPDLREVALERIDDRVRNAQSVIAKGRAAGTLHPSIHDDAVTHFVTALSVGLAVLDPVTPVRPTVRQWDALIGRIGSALEAPDPAEIDLDTSERWRLLISIPQTPMALSRLVRALGALGVSVNEVRVEEGRDDERTVFLGLQAPPDLSADTILGISEAVGTNGYVRRGSPDDDRDLMSRTLDGAARLVRRPDEAPRIAAALVAADTFEVLDAPEGVDDQPGVLRLQWTPDRHVLLRREWCPFTRSEQARASALLRLSAAVASLVGEDGQNGWVDQVKNGTVWIRLARPEDADAVAAMHDRCSDRTKRLRYFSSVEWRDLQLRRLAGGHRGATLVVMSRAGTIVGLGNVFPEGPASDRTAEIALLVEDDWQGRGAGRALLRRMLQVAQLLEFETVVAHLFADNAAVKGLLESTGLQWSTTISDGVADMTAPLPAG